MSQLRPKTGDAPPSARYSLRWRLPLLVSSLVVGVLAVFVWAAYREVEQTLVSAGAERAQGAADQLGTLMAQSARSRLLALRQVASDPALVRYLQHPVDQTDVSVRRRLTTLVTTGHQVIVLWSAVGEPMVAITAPDEAADMAPTGRAAAAVADRATVRDQQARWSSPRASSRFRTWPTVRRWATSPSGVPCRCRLLPTSSIASSAEAPWCWWAAWATGCGPISRG